MEKLALHLRTVHPDVKYPCSECGKVLLSERHRVAHEVIICKVVHPPELLKKLCVKIHKCGVGRCGQLFSRKNNLDMWVVMRCKNLWYFVIVINFLFCFADMSGRNMETVNDGWSLFKVVMYV